MVCPKFSLRMLHPNPLVLHFGFCFDTASCIAFYLYQTTSLRKRGIPWLIPSLSKFFGIPNESESGFWLPPNEDSKPQILLSEDDRSKKTMKNLWDFLAYSSLFTLVCSPCSRWGPHHLPPLRQTVRGSHHLAKWEQSQVMTLWSWQAAASMVCSVSLTQYVSIIVLGMAIEV